MLCRLIIDAETSLLAQKAERRSSSEDSQGPVLLHKASTSVSEGLLPLTVAEPEAEAHPQKQVCSSQQTLQVCALHSVGCSLHKDKQQLTEYFLSLCIACKWSEICGNKVLRQRPCSS